MTETAMERARKVDEFHKEVKDVPTDRMLAAVALKIDGADYYEIADTLGITNHIAAQAIVERGLASLANEEDRAHLRRLTNARLEKLLRPMMDIASQDKVPSSTKTNPDGTPKMVTNYRQLEAARTALAVIDRQARLNGIDAPQKIEIRTPEQEEIAEWVRKKIAESGGEQEDVESDIIEVQIIEDTASAEA